MHGQSSGRRATAPHVAPPPKIAPQWHAAQLPEGGVADNAFALFLGGAQTVLLTAVQQFSYWVVGAVGGCECHYNITPAQRCATRTRFTSNQAQPKHNQPALSSHFPALRGLVTRGPRLILYYSRARRWPPNNNIVRR